MLDDIAWMLTQWGPGYVYRGECMIKRVLVAEGKEWWEAQRDALGATGKLPC